MKSTFGIYKIFCFLIILVFIALIISQADKKFVLDEIDFPAVAKTISQTGYPFEYRGEANYEALGLWHPPLYAYTLGFFIKIFGYSESIVRAFGLCCTLISAFLCLDIYRKLFGFDDDKIYKLGAIFFPLYLLHPYTIANSTLPDIDSTVLPITMLLYISGVIGFISKTKTSNKPDWGGYQTLGMGFLFALALWSKLTTPLVLVPLTFGLLYQRNFSAKSAAMIAANIFILGTLIFLSSYYLYCNLLNLPFGFTFHFLIQSFAKNSATNAGFIEKIYGVIAHFAYARYFINWIGIPFLVTLFISIGLLINNYRRSKPDAQMLLLVGISLFVTAFYLGLTGAFGGFFKYPFPAFPILVLSASGFFFEYIFYKDLRLASEHGLNLENYRTRRELNDGMLTLSGTLILAAFIYYLIHIAAFEGDAIILRNKPMEVYDVCVIFVLSLLLGYIIVRLNYGSVLASLIAGLLIIVVIVQFYTSRAQAISQYPTKYHYGQVGMTDAIAYLKQRLEPDEIIWSMKDIGYYSSGRYIENYGLIFGAESEIDQALQAALDSKGVRFFVVTSNIGQDRVDAYVNLKNSLDRCCFVDKIYGNFVIYRKK